MIDIVKASPDEKDYIKQAKMSIVFYIVNETKKDADV